MQNHLRRHFIMENNTQIDGLYRSFLSNLIGRKKFTQSQLANKIKISPTSLSLFINGNRPLSGNLKTKINDAFDVNENTIVEKQNHLDPQKEIIVLRIKEGPWKPFRMNAGVRGRNKDKVIARQLVQRKTPSPRR